MPLDIRSVFGRWLLVVILIVASSFVSAEEPPNFYLLEYRPGENWSESVSFADQPGIQAHIDYLEQLYVNDIVRMGGETVGQPGALVLLRVGSIEQAEAVAQRDPAVVNRILDYEVTGWRVEMSSMRHSRRMQQPVRDPDKPFRLERLDPDSPINLKD
ncbi:MAG: YciI family protein [Gammaproteobacteria bacterium]|nr:YciI family protein [Gammaproteobacteria bacterium]